MVLLVVLFVVTLIIILLGIQYVYEIRLINYFKFHNIEFEILGKIIQFENLIDEFDMYLLNLNWLPSFKKKYPSLFFNEEFHCKIYPKYIILTMESVGNEPYHIKILRSSYYLKKDIFAGNLLKVEFDKFSLLFKLPNKLQNIIHKYCF